MELHPLTGPDKAVHLLYCDETNLEERPGDFLIYGGITIDASRALDLSKEIDEIRRRAGVPSLSD